MKKFLCVLVLLSIVSITKAQSESGDFDRKFRFGLRVAPQPTWFTIGDKNNTSKGVKLGFGFGLNVERRFSSTVSLLTGVGVDFEGGKYAPKYDPSSGGNYMVTYWDDESGELVKPESGKKKDYTVRYLKQRAVNFTYVTIPVLLKLSTKEYNGLKYYGMFGGEIGIRARALAKDTYYETRKYSNDSTFVTVSGETTESSIDIGKDATAVPLRAGFNVGLGAEYRLASTTAAFMSVNFFRSLTPLMRKESDYMYFRTYNENGKENYRLVKQNLFLTAIRVNIGIMF